MQKKHLWVVEWRRYSRFTFVENANGNPPMITMVTNLPELYFKFRRFILLVQTQKVISVNYSLSTSSWKPWRWVRLDLILLMRDIYINFNLNPLTKFTSSSRSTEFKDILPGNISQMITKTKSSPHKNSHKSCDETRHTLLSLMQSQWKLRQHHDQNFPMEGKPLQNKC